MTQEQEKDPPGAEKNRSGLDACTLPVFAQGRAEGPGNPQIRLSQTRLDPDTLRSSSSLTVSLGHACIILESGEGPDFSSQRRMRDRALNILSWMCVRTHRRRIFYATVRGGPGAFLIDYDHPTIHTKSSAMEGRTINLVHFRLDKNGMAPQLCNHECLIQSRLINPLSNL